MDWFTVNGSLRDHPKWTSLSPEGRGAWITLMTIGHGQPGRMRWTLGPYLHVMELLRREGFGDPARVMVELAARRLIDVTHNGVVSMHDASKHQKFPSDLAHRRTERSTRSKAKARDEAARTGGAAGNGGERQEAAGNDYRQTDRTDKTDRTDSPGGNGVPPDLLTNDPYKLYRALTHEAPDKRHQKWMDDLTVEEGEGDAGRKTVAHVMKQWPGTGDLLGWTSAKLRGGRS